MRRMFIAVAGTGAGLIGAFQIFGSRFSNELAQLSREGSHGDGDFDGFGIACIPAVIGVAFIVLSFFNPNKEQRV